MKNKAVLTFGVFCVAIAIGLAVFLLAKKSGTAATTYHLANGIQVTPVEAAHTESLSARLAG